MELPSYNTSEVVVSYCEAFFKVLNSDCVATHCNNCFLKNAGVETCQGCNMVRYCDDFCKMEDMHNGHQLECSSTGFHNCIEHCAPEGKTMLFRLYALLKMKPDIAGKLYDMYNGTNRCFSELMSNYLLWKNDISTVTLCQDMVDHLRIEFPDIDFDYLVKLYGIFQTNSLPVYDDDQVIGNAIYIQATCFDHSCKPSANCIITNGMLEIRTMIPVGNGVAPTISYCDLSEHNSTIIRKKLLNNKYKFECQCVKCIEEIDTFVDYDRVQSLNLRMKTLFKMKNANNAMEWKAIETMHNELLNFLLQIFNQYDMNVSMYLSNMYSFAIDMRADEELIWNLKNQALGHLSVSVGTENYRYIKCNTMQ